MKIYNEKTKIIFPIIGFIIIIILIAFIQIEIVEKLFIVSPFIILWISSVIEKTKKKKKKKKNKKKKKKKKKNIFKKIIKKKK